MTNYKHGLLHIAEILLKPLYGVKVKVVGRLIKQEVVRITKESLCKHDTYLLVVGEFAHLLLVQCLRDTKIGKHLCSVALSLPTIHFGKLKLKISRTVAVLFSHFQFRIKSLTLLHIVPKRFMTHKNSIENTIFVKFEVVLLKHRKALSRAEFNRTLVWLQVAAYCAQKCRLAGTIGTNNTINITCCKFQINILV